ncbi:MAG: hypothetical protein AB7O24_01530 [Kofleriaceae bacterium]
MTMIVVAAACGGRQPSIAGVQRPEPDAEAEAVSLLGTALQRPRLSAEDRAKRERALEQAIADHAKAPSATTAIWVGRRLGYLHRYREAVAELTRAIAKYDDARLLRFRGHRYITLRKLELAVTDLERAAQMRAGLADEIEPDGAPNPAGIPTSTLHTNIWYHLGLAHYLRRDFVAAARAYRECLRASSNDDMRVAAGYWLYLTLRRLDDTGAAERLLREQLPTNPTLLESHAYHALLQLFRGELAPEAVTRSADLDRTTIAYGVAIWYLLRGEHARADQHLREAMRADQWPAFGSIAAEAELAARAN